MNIASAGEEPALQADFFDEKGVLKEYRPKSMYVLSGTSDDTVYHCLFQTEPNRTDVFLTSSQYYGLKSIPKVLWKG